jgi:HlyD family secretion protein
MPSLKALAIPVALVAAAGYWFLGRDGASSGPVGYQTEAVSIGRIESLVNTAGTISPVVTVDVGSEISGLVSELNADFNSEVKSGQVIARIDDRTTLARLRQIEADVTSAEANIEQQEANIVRTQADLEFAQTEVMRQRELVARQLSSQADLDRAEANIKIATAQLAVARSQLSAARAALIQRRAQLEQTQLDLDRTYIRSPVDGTVIDRQVDVGQTVAASLSAPVLFQIAQDLTQMQIEADVDEADIGQIKEGLTARFTVDAYPNRTFTGSITQVRKAATVTKNVVTYKVIIGAENPRQQLLPGMTANVNIVLGEKDGVLRVNNSALRFNPPGVEPDAGGGFGGGGNFAGRIDDLASELDLNSEQRKAVEAAMATMQESIAQLRNSGGGGFGGGGFPGAGGFGGGARDQMQQMRQRITNQLAGTLTPEQLTLFSQSFGGGGGGFPGGAGGFGGGGREAMADMTPGRLWVLDGGEPRAVRVMSGLSDSQYTEIVAQELGVGDEIIVRLAR